jgi:hypothetical protein
VSPYRTLDEVEHRAEVVVRYSHRCVRDESVEHQLQERGEGVDGHVSSQRAAVDAAL